MRVIASYGIAAHTVQMIRRLVHALLRERGTCQILVQNRRSRHIVCTIHRPGCAAVRVAATAKVIR
jgi:hypothetical protein